MYWVNVGWATMNHDQAQYVPKIHECAIFISSPSTDPLSLAVPCAASCVAVVDKWLDFSSESCTVPMYICDGGFGIDKHDLSGLDD